MTKHTSLPANELYNNPKCIQIALYDLNRLD